MKGKFTWVLLTCWMIIGTVRLSAVESDLRGQFSVHMMRLANEESDISAGIRYIPQIQLSQAVRGKQMVDVELALNGYFSTVAELGNDHLDLYRLNARYLAPQWEFQVGLQKINFGPAQLLRALMWFERMDPRDPLRLTEAVYAARFRYGFLNNASLWFWSLYGNEEAKGYERYATAAGKPEWGGRLQVPVPRGEMALTLHQREGDSGYREFQEMRYALDGRWDVLIGFWFEAVQYRRSVELAGQWDQTVTLGADYTFGIGSGLYMVCEHMFSRRYERFFENDDLMQASALMFNYPLGLFDNIALIGFYAWETDDLYKYLSWQRTYDNLIINLGLFHYPRSQAIASVGQIGAGYGFQIMFIYNH